MRHGVDLVKASVAEISRRGVTAALPWAGVVAMLDGT
jgi:hypothetical protein